MKNKFIKFVSGIALSAMILTACATAPENFNKSSSSLIQSD